MVKVKLCGLRTHNDVDIIHRYTPDYAGFIFASSKRKVTPVLAKELITRITNAQCIGVFVNQPVQEVADIASYCMLDGIQLHGDESLEYVMELRKLIPLPIWKACRIRKREDIIELPGIDHLLLDSFSPTVYGGSGKRINIELLEGFDVSNCFLAGGVDADNVEELIKLHPYGIDVSSSLERNGYKDEEKIKTFMTKVNEIRGKL